MRLFGYYALHSFVNQLRKLLKTWMLIFLLVCMVVGGIIGAGAASLEDLSEQQEAAQEEETELSEEPEIPQQNLAQLMGMETHDLTELITGAVILALFIIQALSADKNGSKIFLPADVNLLFASPMQPQSVLLFRLMTQLGTILAASLYLLFQLPNLVLNLGLSLWAACALLGTWLLSIGIAKLLQVLLYLMSSNHPGFKRQLSRCVYGFLLLVAAGYYLFWKRSGLAPLPAAVAYFNAPLTRYLPLWGWLKGFFLFAVEGNVLGCLLSLAAVLAGGAILLFIIRGVKADFYEDAMAKSEETAALLEEARSEKSNGIVFGKRKKDRSDRIRRDGLNRGAGAAMFFHKSLYNRFRFAHLGFLTKTTETYLAVGLGMAALLRFVVGTRSIVPVALALAALAFFRSLGNPLEEDTKMDFFRLLPEKAWKKLFWSLMGGTVNCLLDSLPALLAAAILLGTNPLEALAWLPFVVSVDLYATAVGVFINLSVPVSAGATIKQVVQVMFIYFGLLPDIGIMAVGLVLDKTALAALIAALLNLFLGGLFLALTPIFLEPGSRAARVRDAEVTDLKEARRTFSRLGFGGATLLVAASLVQVALGALLAAIAGDGEISTWVGWIATFAPIYLVGVPLSLLVFRKVPAHAPARRSLKPGGFLSLIPICLFMMYAGNLLGILVNSLLSGLTHAAPANPIATFATEDSLLLKALFLVILAPIIEEFIFRRVLIDRMRTYGERTAVLTSALMFGLFHGNLSQFFYAAALGLIFGCVYIKTGKLRYSAVLHIFINAIGTLLAPALLKWAGMGLEDSLDLGALAEGSVSVSPGIIAFGIYALLLVFLSLVGLVLTVLKARRLQFEAAPRELPGNSRFRTVWLSAGMLVFTLLCLAMIVFTVLG